MNIHSLQAVPARLAQVRAVMAREHLDAYIVLSSDPHLSEYPPARWQSRAFLSGFTGSAGTLIVTHDFAGVWVDSRYWTQAETQLVGSGAARMKITAQSAVPYLDWLLAHIPAGGTIGVDGGVLSLACAHTLPYAGAPRADKLARIRAAMREHGADWHFLSTLDDIAWLLNMRGADIPYNPVFIAHALIGPESATLFVAPGKMPAPLAESLAAH